MNINYVKMNPAIPDLKRGSAHSAGIDLISTNDDFTIYPGCEAIVSAGCQIEIPEGYWGHISIRSGLGFNQGLATHIGVVDADFRGELKIKLFHFMNMDEVSDIVDDRIQLLTNAWHDNGVLIKKFDRIANLVIVPYLNCNPVEVQRLSDTVRGENGYGSTGR